MSSLFHLNNLIKLSRRSSRAFTLAETLAVISIMGIITTISVMAYMSAKEKRQASVIADKIKSIIMETRLFAFAKPDSLSDAKQISIVIDKSNNTISFYKYNPTATLITPPLISDSSIPNNIQFPCDTYTISIDVSTPTNLGSMTSTGAGGSDASCLGLTNKINVTSGSNTYQLQINQYGGIDIVKIAD